MVVRLFIYISHPMKSADVSPTLSFGGLLWRPRLLREMYFFAVRSRQVVLDLSHMLTLREKRTTRVLTHRFWYAPVTPATVASVWVWVTHGCIFCLCLQKEMYFCMAWRKVHFSCQNSDQWKHPSTCIECTIYLVRGSVIRSWISYQSPFALWMN